MSKQPPEIADLSYGAAALNGPQVTVARGSAHKPKPHLYLFVFGAWLASLAWFHPRLASLLSLADTPLAWGAIGFFVVFTEIAWLYACYNVGVIVFAIRYRRRHRPIFPATTATSTPAVAVHYTTCNDFVEASALSCVSQEYPAFWVYLLDDSSDPAYQARVDDFARRHAECVRVVRRADRRGFKAGNLNHALGHAGIDEPFFALVDADEILPADFLWRIVPRLVADEHCGFVQANHKANPNASSALARSMGVGVDIHWRWYQPLRNRYGFVMLLGHGAVIRRQTWKEIGGFPELVSEDLAFALRARANGWHGVFAEDVTCYEDFPDTVRAFRVRHMKWTRGTCEFLVKEAGSMLASRRIPLVEKLDVLMPTLNLPLSLFYFLFLIDANLVLTSLYSIEHPVTLTAFGREIILPTLTLDARFNVINSMDFFFITLVALVSPVLCFIIDMARTPRKLFRFLAQTTVVYGALGPLSCMGVFFYAITGKAVFHVTADRSARPVGERRSLRARLVHFAAGSHPDHWFVQGFEITCGAVFTIICLKLFQISFLGLSLAFMLLPLLHHVRWDHPLIRKLVFIPLLLVVLGISLGGLSVFGMQTLFFGAGFHF